MGEEAGPETVGGLGGGAPLGEFFGAGLARLDGAIWQVAAALRRVAVDASIALLKRQQRTRYVEVDEAVGLLMEIDVVGGDVGSDEKSDGRVGGTKNLDYLLLIHVGQAAVEDFDLVLWPPERRGDAFGGISACRYAP